MGGFRLRSGRPPLYTLTVNGYAVGMTNPESTFEPDVNLMCDDLFDGFRCTRTCEHEGDHVAHGGHPLRVVCSWPQTSPLGAALLEYMDQREQALKTRFRFAQEIRAAHADPNWLDKF